MAVDASRFVDSGKLRAFCERWKIDEILVYGSVARGEDRPDSDIDLLVTFTPDAEWTLLDHVRLEEELSELMGRQVDMQTKRAIQESRNALRREMILSEAEPFYAA